jgi:hypothetical protein
VTDQYTRISVQRKLSTGVTDVSLQIRSSGTITFNFAHAHALAITEGIYNLATANSTAISCPYIETQSTPVLAQTAWRWPEWLTQNGYIEADVCLSETGTPNLVNRTILISGSNTTLSPAIHQGYVRRSSSYASSVTSIEFAKQNNSGTTFNTYTPASSLYDGAYHKYRLEWVNYLIGAARTIQLRLYVDNVQVATATTAGATSWLRPPTLEILNPSSGSEGFQTMKNIAIGSPVLPANAVPEPY